MLSSEEFQQWNLSRRWSQATTGVIADVRAAPPTRRVKSRSGNVSGRYPSGKMGLTIQFESHTVELAGIYQMEYDSDVLEYYDQPPSIKLNYKGWIERSCYQGQSSSKASLSMGFKNPRLSDCEVENNAAFD